MSLVPCHLAAVVIDEASEQQTVVINETAGERRFPIAIGQMEALAIDRAVKRHVFPRPLTHDLLLATIAALRATVSAVRIVDLRSGTFYAEVALVREDGSALTVDCRPSDALALLVRAPGTPLLVAETVLAEAC